MLFLALIAFALPPLDHGKLLDAIRTVEDVRGSRRPGRHGERGDYALTYDVWQQHSRLDFFRYAYDPVISRQVAQAHLESLCNGLERAGLPITPYTLGLAWNGGLRATVRHRTVASTKDYAERVQNVYFEKTKAPAGALDYLPPAGASCSYEPGASVATQ